MNEGRRPVRGADGEQLRCCICHELVYQDENPLVDDGVRCLVRHRRAEFYAFPGQAQRPDECVRGGGRLGQGFRALEAV